VDEEARQLILLLDKRQAERDRALKEWFDERDAERDRNWKQWLDERDRSWNAWLDERDRRWRDWLDKFAADSIRRHEEVMAEIRAHRDALFRIIDRLDSGGGSAPA
jgi:hypothetical protein